MQLTSVNNNGNSVEYYKNTTADAETGESFSLEMQGEMEETSQDEPKVHKKVSEMSFEELMELIHSGDSRANQIPVVNQIVSSKNPEDGKIYRTFFTDNLITCYDADGKVAWEIDVNEEQQQTVQDYFKEYTSREWAKELYSGYDMSMASVKDFWLKLFEKR